jgi:hypothetical protein
MTAEPRATAVFKHFPFGPQFCFPWRLSLPQDVRARAEQIALTQMIRGGDLDWCEQIVPSGRASAALLMLMQGDYEAARSEILRAVEEWAAEQVKAHRAENEAREDAMALDAEQAARSSRGWRKANDRCRPSLRRHPCGRPSRSSPSGNPQHSKKAGRLHRPAGPARPLPRRHAALSVDAHGAHPVLGRLLDNGR